MSLDATEDTPDGSPSRRLSAICFASLALLHGSCNNSHVVLVAVLHSIHALQSVPRGRKHGHHIWLGSVATAEGS